MNRPECQHCKFLVSVNHRNAYLCNRRHHEDLLDYSTSTDLCITLYKSPYWKKHECGILFSNRWREAHQDSYIGTYYKPAMLAASQLGLVDKCLIDECLWKAK